jgi:hypothetical protein
MVAFSRRESRGGTRGFATRGPVTAESIRAPEVVREKLSRIGYGRVAGTLIFDREFSGREISRFSALRSDGDLNPGDFQLAGRVLQYECRESDEPRWRLAAQIYLVKCFQTKAGGKKKGAGSGRAIFPKDGPIV